VNISILVRRPIPTGSIFGGENKMRIVSVLRAGSLALALTLALGASHEAFAGTTPAPAQQQAQQGSTGVYDGADDQAAKRAFY
jgi:hypothetical protein